MIGRVHVWRRASLRRRWVFLLVGVCIAGSVWWNWHGVAAALPQTNDAYWQDVTDATRATRPLSIAPGRSFAAWRALRLNRGAWQEALRKAPYEHRTALPDSQCVVSLPLPDGTFVRLRIEESPAFDSQLAARFPAIKSYRGQSLDDPTIVARLAWSSRSLHALILTKDDAISVAPLTTGDATTYVSYYGQDAVRPNDVECLAEQLPVAAENNARVTVPQFAFGNVQRQFRIAIATTVEYTNDPNLGGGSSESALASVNAWLNAVNVIYERDLAVHFNLAANNDKVIFGQTDNFTNGNPTAMLAEVRGVLSQTLGTASYDLGHVLGTGNGGTANSAVACVDAGASGAFKGGGVTLFNSAATLGNTFFITRLAHEIAHQFGATHTYNDNEMNSACGPGRNSFSAWEPGSGLTIMSFAGSCNLIATARALHFHGGSLAQMSAFLQNTALCGTRVNANNGVPAVNGGADFRIPRKTPFMLTATATDPDIFDVPNLTYTWEQMDAGSIAYSNPPFTDAADGPNSTRPLFRPALPSLNRFRVFPDPQYILYNANTAPLLRAENGVEVFTAESLPQVARLLNFKVTVRDGRGGVADDDVQLIVDDTAGPFEVTAPNTNEQWASGSSQTITWSVNNTNGAALNVTQVRITLSTDGGNTFPIVLLTATPNDGSETVTVPGGLQSTAARVRVEAIGNIFFDISDADFTLLAGTPSCPTIATLNPPRGQAGVNVTITGEHLAGVSAVRFNNNLNAAFTIISDTQIRAVVPGGATTGPIRLLRSDCPDTASAPFTVAACNYTLNATVRNVAAATSNNNFGVTANAGCAWTAVSNASWITLTSGAAVTGNGTVNFSIAANPGSARTGTLIVAGQTVTVNQASGCNFRLSATNRNFRGTGEDFNVNVMTGEGCPWTASNSVPWITLNANTFIGSNPVTLSVEPNANLERVATLTIAGQTFTVTQDSNCGFNVTPNTRSFSAVAGTGVINVAAGSACTWVAQSHVPWMAITAGGNSTGNNTVTFSVQANTGPPRTGELTIAGRGVTVTQAGGCSFALNRTSQDFTGAGGNGTVNVTAGAGCNWTASSPVDWVTITNGANGNGNGTLSLTVAANTGPARVAMLTLAGQSYTISQASACAVTINAATRQFAPAAATSTLNVAALASCAWSAVSNAPWLAITSSASGTGNGTVGYAVAANTGGARIGTLTIGGVTHTVTQTAAPCTYALNPGSQSVGAAGTSGSFNVTTANHCTWTAASNAGWLSIDGLATGIGNGTVNFSAAPNAGIARTGAFTLGGQTYTVQQEAGCQYQLSAKQLNAVATGESYSVSVTTAPGCAWMAASQSEWLRLTPGNAQGAGAGTLRFEATPNAGSVRSGTLSLGGETLTVTQAGNEVNSALLLANANPPYALAGTGTFALTISGFGFSPNVVARWNDVPRPTIYVSPTQLIATIDAADVANTGVANVTVFDLVQNLVTNRLSYLIAGAGATVSAASYVPGQMAPEQIVSLFGQRLATASASATTTPLPTALAGTTVRVKDSAGVDRLAPLFFVSAGQINHLIPLGTAPGPATVTVVASDGRITITTFDVSAVAPGLFSVDASGKGLPAGLVLRQRGAQQLFEPLSRFDNASRTFVVVPIDLGPTTDQVFLVLYGTGIRQRSNLNAVTCAIGGEVVTAQFAGPQGGLVGLDQVNVPLPRSLAGRGEVEVQLTVDGKTANTLKVHVR
jgi:uncharacterized protein (TIGR03437 family)